MQYDKELSTFGDTKEKEGYFEQKKQIDKSYT